jgi:hypothetical protein
MTCDICGFVNSPVRAVLNRPHGPVQDLCEECWEPWQVYLDRGIIALKRWREERTKDDNGKCRREPIGDLG